MQQDIREKLKGYCPENIELSQNHNRKFENLLNNEIHKTKTKKINFKWLSVAASIVLFIVLVFSDIFCHRFTPNTRYQFFLKNVGY